MNWCGQWFEYFPNPPLNVLAMIENTLAHHDATLLEHLIKHGVTSHVSMHIHVVALLLRHQILFDFKIVQCMCTTVHVI